MKRIIIITTQYGQDPTDELLAGLLYEANPLLMVLIMYTANCIKVVLRQSEKVKAKREKYDGSD
jgi:hypothetical protein